MPVVKSFAPVGAMLLGTDGVEHFVPARTLMAGLRRTKRVRIERTEEAE